MTALAFITVLADAVLFLWGIWLGLAGLTADHPPFREGGHAPGAEGTYDPAYMEARKSEALKAA